MSSRRMMMTYIMSHQSKLPQLDAPFIYIVEDKLHIVKMENVDTYGIFINGEEINAQLENDLNLVEIFGATKTENVLEIE